MALERQINEYASMRWGLAGQHAASRADLCPSSRPLLFVFIEAAVYGVTIAPGIDYAIVL